MMSRPNLLLLFGNVASSSSVLDSDSNLSKFLSFVPVKLFQFEWKFGRSSSGKNMLEQLRQVLALEGMIQFEQIGTWLERESDFIFFNFSLLLTYSSRYVTKVREDEFDVMKFNFNHRSMLTASCNEVDWIISILNCVFVYGKRCTLNFGP